MRQTRRHSLTESCTNVLIGYLVALASQLAIFPMFGIYVPFRDNIMIGLYFTVISIIRSYALRRWFTGRAVRV
ncbi:MAG TPA: hypothetical protein DCZ63_00555 [Geobacter sp.]|nr:hypothetical protein [Geobacter sp.]